MKKHLDIKIYGRVQGVSFRISAREEANRLGIVGFAQNDPDGTVLIEVEGEEKNLKKFLEWCQEGSQASQVENVKYNISDELKGYKSFEKY